MRGGGECEVILSCRAELADLSVSGWSRYRGAPKNSIKMGVITSGGAL
jgi:hypothetical protein